jgi:hypothetical protein
MKIGLGGLATVVLVAIAWPAAAQGVPPGTYLQSCSEVRMRGDTLIAYCRRPDGHGNWTWINNVGRCRGDIGNHGGWLNCNFAGPPGPPPPDGRAERRRERCEDLRDEARNLRRRIEREYNPIDRARLEGRLQEVNEQRERCPR